MFDHGVQPLKGVKEHPTVSTLLRELLNVLQIYPAGLLRPKAIEYTAKRVKNKDVGRWAHKWSLALSYGVNPAVGWIEKNDGYGDKQELKLTTKGEQLLASTNFLFLFKEGMRKVRYEKSEPEPTTTPNEEEPGIEAVIPPKPAPPPPPITAPPPTVKPAATAPVPPKAFSDITQMHRTRQFLKDIGGKDKALYYIKQVEIFQEPI